MRKFALVAAVLALIAGAAVYAVACDKNTQKASGAQTSSCPASKASATVLTGTDAGCSSSKTTAAKTGAGCDHAAKAACPMGKGAAAASGGCGMKDAAAGCCAGDKECVNYVITVADMQGDCCVEKIETALSRVKNVQAVYVDVESHKAYVCTGQAKFDKKAAVKSVEKVGFKSVKFAGTDTEHCVHKMKEAKASDAGKV